jgi:hypothetical protein
MFDVMLNRCRSRLVAGSKCSYFSNGRRVSRTELFIHMFKPLLYNIFQGVSWTDGRHVEGLSQAYLQRFGNPSITHTHTNAGANRHIREGIATVL